MNLRKEKTCPGCKMLLPIESFRIRNTGRIESYCRPCEALNMARWRKNNPLGWIKTREKYEAKNNKTSKRLSQQNETAKRMYKLYPEKWRARARLRYAVKKGKILKPEYCQREDPLGVNCTGRIHAHHYAGYDGDNWSKVDWLCHKHHMIAHNRYRKSNLTI